MILSLRDGTLALRNWFKLTKTSGLHLAYCQKFSASAISSLKAVEKSTCRRECLESCDRKTLNYFARNVPSAFIADHSPFLGDFGLVCCEEQVAGANRGTFQPVFLTKNGLKLIRRWITRVKCLTFEDYELLLAVNTPLIRNKNTRMTFPGPYFPGVQSRLPVACALTQRFRPRSSRSGRE
jgi:hypothetical protein